MKRAFLFVMGCVAGSAITYAALASSRFYAALDDGIGYSYRCEELARQADERDMLHELAKLAYVGMPDDELERSLIAHDLLGFRKGPETIIAESKGLGFGIEFVLSDGEVNEIVISGIDGRCSPPQGGN